MFRYSRRKFLTSSAALAASLALPPLSTQAAVKFTRYNVTSPQGQKMLVSYAKGIKAMLNLPASHPQNWFRNAFIHLMDCPHGNWWFYVWHRAYIGYFESTIRTLSDDNNFTLPYWDWTQLPKIPDSMFEGVLTPTDKAYQPYTENLAVFEAFIRPALNEYWKSLSATQLIQQANRGYKSSDDVWDSVTGAGHSGDEAYAVTCASRYLSRGNPKLDANATHDVSPFIVKSGLKPTDFYNADSSLSFTSSKTLSHVDQPDGSTSFSILEGLPHNIVHNSIGGVGAIDPGPYGNMTNFLSPVDPIFFLHHANMDRLWDVWTRKQQALKLPYLPSGQDLASLANEPFLFYVDGQGRHVGPSKAGNYFSTDVFGYDYAPGFGDAIIQAPATPLAAVKAEAHLKGTIQNNIGTVMVPHDMVQGHLSENAPRTLVASITLPRPSGLGAGREFDVLVNAPPGVTQVSTDSPYYAGTVAFFGPNMMGMKMSVDTTFVVPLPKKLQVFSDLTVTKGAILNIRVVPARGKGKETPRLEAISVKAL